MREIPYMVNKTLLIESIVQVVKDKRVDGISDINDESDREAMRIVIELKSGANAQVVLNLSLIHICAAHAVKGGIKGIRSSRTL